VNFVHEYVRDALQAGVALYSRATATRVSSVTLEGTQHNASSAADTYQTTRGTVAATLLSVTAHRTCSRRSSTPVVQNNSRVAADRDDSRRIWYPTVLPTFSSRSAATLHCIAKHTMQHVWGRVYTTGRE
jgi:hypothetical protein